MLHGLQGYTTTLVVQRMPIVACILPESQADLPVRCGRLHHRSAGYAGTGEDHGLLPTLDSISGEPQRFPCNMPVRASKRK
jgi:hypothetical protein